MDFHGGSKCLITFWVGWGLCSPDLCNTILSRVTTEMDFLCVCHLKRGIRTIGALMHTSAEFPYMDVFCPSPAIWKQEHICMLVFTQYLCVYVCMCVREREREREFKLSPDSLRSTLVICIKYPQDSQPPNTHLSPFFLCVFCLFLDCCYGE